MIVGLRMRSLKKSMYNDFGGQVLFGSLLIRKDNLIGEKFSSGFSWGEAVDAAADIYNGVSQTVGYMSVRCTND